MKKLIRKWLGLDDLETSFCVHKKRADSYIEYIKAHRGHISNLQRRIAHLENKLKNQNNESKTRTKNKR